MTVATNTERINRLEKIVVGNGEPGMDEDLRTVKRVVAEIKKDVAHVKDTYSDIKLFWSVYRIRENLDAQGNPLEKEKEPEFLSFAWMKRYIFPGLVEKAIIAISTAAFVLIVTNWPL